jgi:hypothetical protein
MREIEGAAAMIDGDAKRISGIRVLGRYRLQVRLTKPVGDLTARLTMPFFCPILPNTPIEPQGIDNTPGSGPYYIAERIVNQRIVLRRNTYYRGNRPANVDQVIWTIGETRETALRRSRAIESTIVSISAFPRPRAEASPRSTASTGRGANSSSPPALRHGSLPSITIGRRSGGRSDPAQEGSYSPPRWLARRASTRSTARSREPLAAGTRDRASARPGWFSTPRTHRSPSSSPRH